MAAIPLNEAHLAFLKKSLRDEFPDAKSSHLTEALAFSLGFRSNASLLSALVGPEQDRPFRLLNSDRMVERLIQFGYPPDPEFDFDRLKDDTDVDGLVSTMPYSAYDIQYTTSRQKAWRNLMVCAVNAALAQLLLTLRPSDDRFVDNNRAGHLFEFTLPNGLKARGAVFEAGFDEIKIHAAVNPKGDRVLVNDAGFDAGDAFGITWIERRRGSWMQTCLTTFRCRRALVKKLASLDVEPCGFGDRGDVII